MNVGKQKEENINETKKEYKLEIRESIKNL